MDSPLPAADHVAVDAGLGVAETERQKPEVLGRLIELPSATETLLTKQRVRNPILLGHVPTSGAYRCPGTPFVPVISSQHERRRARRRGQPSISQVARLALSHPSHPGASCRPTPRARAKTCLAASPSLARVGLPGRRTARYPHLLSGGPPTGPSVMGISKGEAGGDGIRELEVTGVTWPWGGGGKRGRPRKPPKAGRPACLWPSQGLPGGQCGRQPVAGMALCPAHAGILDGAVGPACAWPGCEQTDLFLPMCLYHRKVAAGLLDQHRA